MMVTEDISSCEDMEPMDSVIAVHIVFLSIRCVRYKLCLLVKSMFEVRGGTEVDKLTVLSQTGQLCTSKWTIMGDNGPPKERPVLLL